MEWDFTANQEIDETALGTAPEGYRGAYAKDEATGKYKIADAYRPFVDAITGLGGALRNERKTSGELKGKKDVNAVLQEALGFDSVETAKAKFDELNGLVATASKVDPAKIQADIEKRFNGQMAEKDTELESMRGTLKTYLVDNSAVTALATAKGNSKLMLPLIREQVDVVKDGENGYVVRVKDGAGDYRGNGKGGFMSVEELVNEMKASKDYAGAFESENPRGTGPTNQQRPGPVVRNGLSTNQQGEQRNSATRIADGLAARRGR
jgi:hypothetical protein